MLKVLALIAWRNLWRRTRRTVLTASTVALGLSLLLITLGLGDGGHRQMIESAVRMGAGHVVFQSSGYQEKGGIERALLEEQSRGVREWLKQAASRYPIEQVLPRIFASGLASSAGGSTGVQIIGIDPRLELSTSKFTEKLVQGDFLSEAEEDRVLVGLGVARKLEVEVGDKLVLMGQAVGTWEIASRLVRVRGIVETGQPELDQILVLAPLRFAQSFFRLEGRVHQVAVILEDSRFSEALAADAAGRVAGTESLSWQEALPDLRDFIKVDDGSAYVFHVITFLLIAFMVLNTLLMAVLERSREFSLLDALGLGPGERFAMVMMEGLLLALLASAGGVLIGYLGHLYFQAYGIPLDLFTDEEITAAGVAFEPILYSYLALHRILQSIGWIFTMTLALSIIPAARAARRGNVHILGS